MKTHLPHVEDLVLLHHHGIRETLDVLTNPGECTIKYDGAPAFRCQWWGDKFFVFYKTSKFPHLLDSQMEDQNLKAKMDQLLLLKELPRFDGLLWGDYLYSPISHVRIEPQAGIYYHPNVLGYPLPISTHKLGVAFHTYENGSETLKELLGRFKDNETVYFPEIFAEYDPTENDTALLYHLSTFIDRLTHPEIVDAVGKELLTYFNSLIRKGQDFSYVGSYYNFLYWLQNHYSREIDARVTEKGKDVWRQKYQNVIDLCTVDNLEPILAFMEEARAVKLKCINRLNRSSDVRVWHKDNGIERTTHEGFVLQGESFEAVKLVDRSNFSYFNFSPDYIKGWES